MARNQTDTDNILHPLVQRTIAPNAKCNGCLRYVTHQTVCTAGLTPRSCGDGSDPKSGYTPISELSPTEPSNVTTSAQAVAGKDKTAHNEGFERTPTQFLGDELAEWNAMLLHAQNTLINKGRQGCVACMRGPMTGHISPSLAGVMAQQHTCSVEVSEPFAKAMLNRVSPKVRLRIGEIAKGVDLAEPFHIVKAAIERELTKVGKLRKAEDEESSAEKSMFNAGAPKPRMNPRLATTTKPGQQPPKKPAGPTPSWGHGKRYQ